MAGIAQPIGSPQTTWHVASIGSTAGPGVITSSNTPVGKTSFSDFAGSGKLVQGEGASSNRIKNCTGQDPFGQTPNNTDVAAGSGESFSIAGAATNDAFSVTIGVRSNDAIHQLLLDVGGSGWKSGQQLHFAVAYGWSPSSTAPSADTSIIYVPCQLSSVTYGSVLADGYTSATINFAPSARATWINA